jgi:hypothetical protein
MLNIDNAIKSYYNEDKIKWNLRSNRSKSKQAGIK